LQLESDLRENGIQESDLRENGIAMFGYILRSLKRENRIKKAIKKCVIEQTEHDSRTMDCFSTYKRFVFGISGLRVMDVVGLNYELREWVSEMLWVYKSP